VFNKFYKSVFALNKVDVVATIRKEQLMLSRMNAVRFFVIFAMMFGYASTMLIEA